ncbi:MAG: diguanylate cyclase [Acidimicrobiales bacterium]
MAAECHVTLIEGDGRLAVHLVPWDVTERRNEASRLAWEANHDPLTRLYNRQAVSEHVECLLHPSEGAASGTLVALLLVALDGFKTVNDTLGYQAGDLVLVDVARRLQTAAPGKTVGRIGGDEFVVAWASRRFGEVARVAAAVNQAIVLEVPLVAAGRLPRSPPAWGRRSHAQVPCRLPSSSGAPTGRCTGPSEPADDGRSTSRPSSGRLGCRPAGRTWPAADHLPGGYVFGVGAGTLVGRRRFSICTATGALVAVTPSSSATTLRTL